METVKIFDIFGITRTMLGGESLGPELVTNGDFSLASDWNPTGATIAGGVATFDFALNPSPRIFQSIVAAVFGKSYRLTYEIVSNTMVGGTFNFFASSSLVTPSLVLVDTAGSHTVDIVYNGAGDRLYFRHLSASSGMLVLDNVSLKEIL